MTTTTTTNLAEFGYRELKLLELLLTAMREQGLPNDFYNDEVHPMMNKNSGNVFLTNSDYQCAMMNGDKLETWYNCYNCGHEGFAEDCSLIDECCNECAPYTNEAETEEFDKAFESMKPIIELECCCCGQDIIGRQWWNRDTCYGLCTKCAEIISKKEDSETMESCYGKNGIHYNIK
jgi:hypothetical protein